MWAFNHQTIRDTEDHQTKDVVVTRVVARNPAIFDDSGVFEVTVHGINCENGPI